MTLVNSKKAEKFFKSKLEFTTGPVELDSMMKSGENINMIDVRLPVDYAIGHIPGAMNLPKENWDTFKGLSIDKINIIYCYSEACHLAAAGAREFAAHGYSVMELEGGFEGWKKNNLPVKA